MEDTNIRSFIAIELPDELKRGLKVFQDRLKLPKYNFVKWVAVDGIHMTLKFLGNITLKQTDEVKSSLASIAQFQQKFALKTANIGAFPDTQRIRILWLGLEGDISKLIELQQTLDSSFLRQGFKSEKRPFIPHLTLARVKQNCHLNERREFGELIEGAKYEPIYYFEVDKISIMRSHLLPGGAVYSKIADFRLGKVGDSQ